VALPKNSQLPQLLENLRFQLKVQGLRQQDIADQLSVGLATVKRWLHGGSLSLNRLEDLCRLANLDLHELILATDTSKRKKLQVDFTPLQETALGGNPSLVFIFFGLLHGWSIDNCISDLRISETEMERHLATLERLALIERPSPSRIRVKTERDVTWQPHGPIAKYFQAKVSFVDVGQNDPEAISMGSFLPLNEQSVIKVQQLFEEVMHDVHQLAEPSTTQAQHNRKLYGILLFARPLNMRRIREHVSKNKES
jgi:transcriptional regulator with XRE-family HTH domain